ncbi:MAG TPA: RNA polymerase sigma factor [Firmicutes bacterium]|nr:RNA polymerase sigma factor [Bacillota bacterium]
MGVTTTGELPSGQGERGPRHDALFCRLVAEYRTRVWHLAYQMLHDRDEADDACQEVFYRVFRQLSRFRGDSHPYTWIYRITVNYCTDIMRKRSRRQLVPLEETYPSTGESDPPARGAVVADLPSTMGNPEEAAGQQELVLALKEALDKLPDHYRLSIILRDIQGLAYKDIARILGVPVGTVMSRLYYGKKKLRKMLGHLLDDVE